VFYGTSTQDRSICANLPGGLLAQIKYQINSLSSNDCKTSSSNEIMQQANKINNNYNYY